MLRPVPTRPPRRCAVALRGLFVGVIAWGCAIAMSPQAHAQDAPDARPDPPRSRLMEALQEPDDGPQKLNPAPLMLDRKASHLLATDGPPGGAIHQLVYGRWRDTWTPFALTSTGVMRFHAPTKRWLPVPIPPLDDPSRAALPIRVDPSHLAGQRNVTPPHDVALWPTSSGFVLGSARTSWFLADAPNPETISTWRSITPPETTAAGTAPWHKAELVGAGRISADSDAFVVLRADDAPNPDGASPTPERSRLWRWQGGSWSSDDIDGRAALLTVATDTLGASWRHQGVVGAVGRPGASPTVERFVRPLPIAGRPDAPRWRGFPWAERLAATPSAAARDRCLGVEGMLEIPPANDPDAPPVMIGIAPRTLCISTDGGRTFEARQEVFAPQQRGDFIGALTTATAFAYPSAEIGVRLIVGTERVFNPVAPPSRAYGGRLLMSDNGGFTWRDITPSIDAPGAFIDLISRGSIGARGEQDVEVWLVTERRGAYRSDLGGLNFIQRNQGISAMPVHQLMADLDSPEDVWAATPAGLYRFSGSLWSHVDVVPMRSLGSNRDPDAPFHQRWAGTWLGQVFYKDLRGGLQYTPLPLSAAPKRLRVLQGRLDPAISAGAPMRPVSAVVPTGRALDHSELGYALVDGEGVARLEGGTWTWLTLPPSGPVDVIAATIADAGKTADGLALVVRTTGSDGRTTHAVWVHKPGGAWAILGLPDTLTPLAAASARERLWIATADRALQAVELRDLAPSLGARIELPITCHLTPKRPDGGITCVEPSTTPGLVPDSPTLRRPILSALPIGPDTLNLAPSRAPLPKPRLYKAINPLGRPFADTLRATHTINPVGVHLFVSPGAQVYAAVQALHPYLPPEVERELDDLDVHEELPFWRRWLGALIALTLVLLSIPAIYLIVRRQRTVAKRTDGVKDDPLAHIPRKRAKLGRAFPFEAKEAEDADAEGSAPDDASADPPSDDDAADTAQPDQAPEAPPKGEAPDS